jgi:proteasome assembly chaperone (PAC2) family protein
MGTCSSIEMKRALSPYNILSELNYQSTGGQKPTLNSFLLWTAQKRRIPGVSLWGPIPFYLVNVGDYLAQKMILEFFNLKFGLEIDTGDTEDPVKRQNVKIAEARNKIPEIDGYITKLETNLKLTEEESQELINKIESYLKNG